MTQVDVRGKHEPFQEGRNPPAADRVNGKRDAAHSGHFVRRRPLPNDSLVEGIAG